MISKKNLSFISIALAATVLTGCGGERIKPDPIAQPTPKLEKSYWKLDVMSGLQVSQIMDATVSFENGKVSGSGGCNLYFADYKLTNGGFRLGAINTTKRLCSADISSREDLLLNMLSSVERYGISAKGQLIVYADFSDQPILLNPAKRNEVRTLVSSK